MNRTPLLATAFLLYIGIAIPVVGAYPDLLTYGWYMVVAVPVLLFVRLVLWCLSPAVPAVRAVFEHRERMHATTAPTLPESTTPATITTTTDELAEFCKECMVVVVGEGYPFPAWGTPNWSVTAVIRHLVRKQNGVPVGGGNRFARASTNLDKLHQLYEDRRKLWETEQPEVTALASAPRREG